jgi:hypothetical protein
MSTHTDSIGQVVNVYDDDDLNVYRHNTWDPANYTEEDTSAGGQLMGETEFWNEFVNPETGEVMTETTIQFGKSFDPIIATMHELAKGMDLAEIAQASKGGALFDIKQKYKNTGGLLNGKYATSRSAGNFLAGYNAASGTFMGVGISFTTFQKLAGALHIEESHRKTLSNAQKANIVFAGTYIGGSDIMTFIKPPTYGESPYQYRMSKMGWNYGKKK